jgi:hypothetical protein
MQDGVQAAEALSSSSSSNSGGGSSDGNSRGAAGGSAAISTADLRRTAVEAWRALGEGLNTLAVVPLCNNPACVNLSGFAEVGLVNGPTCMCANCRIAHYCSKACQRLHCKQHKPVCAALVAAKQQQPAEQQQQQACS